MELQSDCIPLVDNPSINPLIRDYLLEHQDLKSLYAYSPDFKGIQEALQQRKSFPASRRMILTDTLLEQYITLGLADEKRVALIESLRLTTTFTVTTGQQLGLILGPLYTILKISNTIALASELSKRNPENRFVPVFWLASEDHDIEEINHFVLNQRKFTWSSNQSGPAGRLKTEGIAELLIEAFQEHAEVPGMKSFIDLCNTAYRLPNLSQATRYLVHHLFADTDLLIIDADHPELKRQFSQIMFEDITKQVSYHKSRKPIAQLETSYHVQVQGREINFFYLSTGSRERIELSSSGYQTTDGQHHWSEAELLHEIGQSPEAFSPNVMMRPVYQEFILPNLAYIGGAAELAYWLELKPVFEAFEVPFPAVLLRNSAMFLNRVNHHRFVNAGLKNQDLFLSLHELEKKVVLSQSATDFSLKNETSDLETWFLQLTEKASLVHPSLERASEAMKQRFLNQTDRFAKKLIREAKKKERENGFRIHELYEHLHPNNSLQERVHCLPHFLEHYCSDFLRLLLENMHCEPASMVVFKF
jgi:bacillithiol biosynthesis cysteine-adding enzyme BshC